MSATSKLICYLNLHMGLRRYEFRHDPDVIIKFHIFANNTDNFTEYAEEALSDYRRFKREFGSSRLFIDVDDGEGQTLLEDCLLSYRGFPA